MNKQDNLAILWWVGWIAVSILTFFVSCFFWTRFIAEKVGPINQPGVAVLWVAAVFGTWMVMLVPLIIVMYQKVDKAYEDARIAREKNQFEKKSSLFKVKSVLVDESKRQLTKDLSKKMKSWPEAIRRGHLVTAILRDGRRIENVFVLNRRVVLGVYGVQDMPFQVEHIQDLEPSDLDHIPNFKSEDWLRLDGVGRE